MLHGGYFLYLGMKEQRVFKIEWREFFSRNFKSGRLQSLYFILKLNNHAAITAILLRSCVSLKEKKIFSTYLKIKLFYTSSDRSGKQKIGDFFTVIITAAGAPSLPASPQNGKMGRRRRPLEGHRVGRIRTERGELALGGNQRTPLESRPFKSAPLFHCARR